MKHFRHPMEFSQSSSRYVPDSSWPEGLQKKYPKGFKLCIDMPNLKRRTQFVLDMISNHKTQLQVFFCDAATMQNANREFRGKDKLTDVLSFFPSPGMIAQSLMSQQQDSSPVSSRKPKPPTKDFKVPMGDILICVPVCVHQSMRFRVSVAVEMEKLLLHSIAHLWGLDHERSDAAHALQTQFEKALKNHLVQELGGPSWVHLS